MRNEHMMDPTEILRFKNLQQARTESIAKTVFYGLQIVYGMYWYVARGSSPELTCRGSSLASWLTRFPHAYRMVSAIVVTAAPRKRGKKL